MEEKKMEPELQWDEQSSRNLAAPLLRVKHLVVPVSSYVRIKTLTEGMDTEKSPLWFCA